MTTLHDVFVVLDVRGDGVVSRGAVEVFAKAQPGVSRPTPAAVAQLCRTPLDEAAFRDAVRVLASACGTTPEAMSSHYADYCLNDVYTLLGGGNPVKASALRNVVSTIGTHNLNSEAVRRIFADEGGGVVSCSEFVELAHCLGKDMPLAALLNIFKKETDGTPKAKSRAEKEGRVVRLQEMERELSHKSIQLCEYEEKLKRMTTEIESLKKKNRSLSAQLRDSTDAAAATASPSSDPVVTELLQSALEIRTGEVQLLHNSLVQVARYLGSPALSDSVDPTQAKLLTTIGKTLGVVIAHSTETVKADATAHLGTPSIEAALQQKPAQPVQLARKNYRVLPTLLTEISERAKRQVDVNASVRTEPAGFSNRSQVQAPRQASKAPPAATRSKSYDPNPAHTAEVAALRTQLSAAQNAILASAGAASENDTKLRLAQRTLHSVVGRQRSAMRSVSPSHAVERSVSAAVPGGGGGGGGVAGGSYATAPVFCPQYTRSLSRSVSPGVASASVAPAYPALHTQAPDISTAPPAIQRTIMQALGSDAPRALSRSPSPFNGAPPGYYGR